MNMTSTYSYSTYQSTKHSAAEPLAALEFRGTLLIIQKLARSACIIRRC